MGSSYSPLNFPRLLLKGKRQRTLISCDTEWPFSSLLRSPCLSVIQSHQSFWSKKFFLADFPLWHQISPWHISFQKRHFHPFHLHSLPFRYTVLLWQVVLWLIASYLSLYAISRLSIQFSVSSVISVSMWLKIERPTFTPWLLSNLRIHLKMMLQQNIFLNKMFW